MATTKKYAVNRDGDLRTMLELRRDQLTSDVQGKLRDVLTRSSTDREGSTEHEGAESNIQGEIELALIQMKSETVRRIGAALRRLDRGTYGNCVECARPISKERLRALPFAARCTGCEEARETTEHRPSPDRRGYDPLNLDLSHRRAHRPAEGEPF